MSAQRTLVLGGVRSGKSRHAEALALGSGAEVIYLATAQARGDAEMRARIATHRERRPPRWCTVEAPLALAAALREHDGADRCLLVECLTLWLTNLLCDDDATMRVREREALIETLPQLRARVILVGNETGLGVVPLGELTRRYVDEAGALHQRLAALCDHVVLCVAGLPLELKRPTP